MGYGEDSRSVFSIRMIAAGIVWVDDSLPVVYYGRRGLTQVFCVS
jgi:hypothetical protein